MPICPLCDESYQPTDRDLPEGFCESCAEVMDNSELYHILRKHFNAVPVAVFKRCQHCGRAISDENLDADWCEGEWNEYNAAQ